MAIVRILYGGYLLLRFSEALELASATYGETHHFLLSGTAFFLFAFGVLLLAVGVREVGERIAITWHVVLEILLVPLSLYFAYTTSLSGCGRLLAALTPSHRFVICSVIFLAAQGLLAMTGFHILRWVIVANQRRNSPRNG